MKSSKIFFLSLLLGLFLLPAATIAQEAPRIVEDKTLYVLLDNSRGELTIDQFAYLSQAVEKAFEAHGHDGAIDVRRWGANAKRGEQSITLRILQWKEFVPGEIECRLYAVAQIGDAEKDLGVVVGSESGIATAGTSSRLTDIYREAAYKSVEELIDKLVEEEWLPAASGEDE